MNHHQGNNGTIFGTAGGTLLSLATNIHIDDLIKTAFLAVVGATTSFICSIMLKQCYMWARSRLKK